MFRTMTLNSMTDTEFLGLKECCRREEVEKTIPLLLRQKHLNGLLNLIEITRRK